MGATHFLATNEAELRKALLQSGAYIRPHRA